MLKVVLMSSVLLSVLEGCTSTTSMYLENDAGLKVVCQTTVNGAVRFRDVLFANEPCAQKYESEGYHVVHPPGGQF